MVFILSKKDPAARRALKTNVFFKSLTKFPEKKFWNLFWNPLVANI